MKHLFVALAFIAGISTIIYPQDEKLYDEFKSNFKKKYLSVGLLFQGITDFQADRVLQGKNGFAVANMRLKLSGEFDFGFGYAVQTNFVKSPSLLDGFMYHKFNKLLKVQIGQFKAPFSAEELISSSKIDFVNRAQVNLLALKRQIGLMVALNTDNKLINFNAGIFNGNGTNTSNDNNNFLYAARLLVKPSIGSEDKLEIAGNGAYSIDSNDKINGKRTVFGADFRLEKSNFLLSSEFIYQKIENGLVYKSSGYHITAGYKLSDKIQVLGRWDSFTPDLDLQSESELIIAGLNIWPTSVTEFQINYIINTDDSDFEHHRILINSQVSL